MTWETSSPRIETWESNHTRDDIWATLSALPHEILIVREALLLGLVNGSVYEGECACLVGTMAKAIGKNFNQIKGLVPHATRPSEMWFRNIRPGDTPENNQFSALAVKWIDELLGNWGVVIP